MGARHGIGGRTRVAARDRASHRASTTTSSDGRFSGWLTGEGMARDVLCTRGMRFAACIVGPLALWALACDGPPPEETPYEPAPPAAPDAGPPVPTVTLPGTTQPSAEPGLCTSWSSTVIDLSSLARPMTFVHGVEGGFSVVTATEDMSRVAALAFDLAGTPRAAETDLPIEDGALSDVIATSEGGWLAAWSSAASGSLTFVHYDASGIPTGQTASRSGSGALLGAEPGGATDVAWSSSSPSWSSQMATVSAYPFALSHGSSFAPGVEESWLGWRRGTLLSLECAVTGYCEYTVVGETLHTWDASGQPVLDVVLPDDLASAMATGAARASPGDDPSTAIAVQASGVSFVSSSQVLVVPSDVLLNGGAPWPSAASMGAQRAVVGFDGHVAGDGGGSDALRIVEVSSTGARSPVGDAALPPNALRAFSASTVFLTATLAEDAYLVVLAGPTIEGAVFTCTGRAS